MDHGLLRKNEGDEVEKIFSEQFDMNLVRVNAQDRFLDKLAGVTEPERKRKIIGEEFIRVFEDEAKKIGKVDYLVQGTIVPRRNRERHRRCGGYQEPSQRWRTAGIRCD